ncbi:hypothetical protein GCM10010156_52570 [Planobispora rosea]|uniref:DUF3987 domain-containing protein n=1 Tax=Planobispora rosea TaxID=35762 RepID=A0A8J3WE65_PLARO|nr:DUF3987 domain-containing protein [Planobispora rosea]GGS87561.1 hypothetical protein GCM10010156_52570 [Planobispora rosea]GIH86659.1 hypothetical protein Pro02_50670 [Planobispora rosea]
MTVSLSEPAWVADVEKDDAKGPSSSLAERPWPTLGEAAFHGLPGRIVKEIDPHTEADPAAMLFTLYSAAGALIGRKPHMYAGGEEHGTRIWPIIIGATAGGMKGTSWAEIRRVIRFADEEFCKTKIMGGLSSAEGLIVQIRDPSGDPHDDDFDEGVQDKRLLIVESEFATVLAQGKREGNTLLPRLREAWDGSTLRTMTIRPRIATDPHVVIIGHITPTELRKKLSEAERAGGTMNRFLPVMSRRSKRLPDGGDLADATLKGLGVELHQVVQQASKVGKMTRTLEAAKYWQELYVRLTADHAGDGAVAQVVARAAPQVLRLSATAALLDGCRQIDVVHLKVAEAMWSYVEDSAWYVFGSGSGNQDLDRLRTFVDVAGEKGASRTDVNTVCFGGNRKKVELDALWAALLELGDYEEFMIPTAGRPSKGLRRKKGK